MTSQPSVNTPSTPGVSVRPQGRGYLMSIPIIRRAANGGGGASTSTTVTFNAPVGNVTINTGAGQAQQPQPQAYGSVGGSSSPCVSTSMTTTPRDQSFYVGTSAGQSSTYIGCSGAGGEFHTAGGTGVDSYSRVHMGNGGGGTAGQQAQSDVVENSLLPLMALAAIQQQHQRRQPNNNNTG